MQAGQTLPDPLRAHATGQVCSTILSADKMALERLNSAFRAAAAGDPTETVEPIGHGTNASYRTAGTNG